MMHTYNVGFCVSLYYRPLIYELIDLFPAVPGYNGKEMWHLKWSILYRSSYKISNLSFSSLSVALQLSTFWSTASILLLLFFTVTRFMANDPNVLFSNRTDCVTERLRTFHYKFKVLRVANQLRDWIGRIMA